MAQQQELLEIQTATLSTSAWPFEKYQFHLIGKVADTPAVTRYSVIRIMAPQLVCGGSHDLGSRQSPVGSQPLLDPLLIRLTDSFQLFVLMALPVIRLLTRCSPLADPFFF